MLVPIRIGCGVVEVGMLSTAAFALVTFAVVVGFRFAERYDGTKLTRLLVASPGEGWASWFLNITSRLFAQKTTLTAMGILTQANLSGLNEE